MAAALTLALPPATLALSHERGSSHLMLSLPRGRLASLALVLALAGSGCGAFESKTYKLNPDEIATLRAAYGSDLEAMRVQLSKDWGVQVDGLNKRMEATVAPLAVEVGKIALQGAGQVAPAAATGDWFKAVFAILGIGGMAGGAAIARRKVEAEHKRVADPKGGTS